MKRALTALILIVCSFLPASGYMTDWTTVATEVEKSLLYLTKDDGSVCSGFSIDRDRDYIVTAAHCTGFGLSADGTLAEEVWKDKRKDIAVLRVRDHNKPALKLADDNPEIGAEVMAVGYGYGRDRLLFRTMHVSDTEVYVADSPFDVTGPFIMTDSPLIPGQSGGPIVTLDGKVAILAQWGTKDAGGGLGVEALRSKIGKYLQKDKDKR
jgi:serine protease Do